MISIDIDGPSTMLNSICESIVITQGSVYNHTPAQPIADEPISCISSHVDSSLEHSRSRTPSKKDKIEITDRWHDQTIIHGSSATWRSPFKAKKSTSAPRNTAQSLFAPLDTAEQSSPLPVPDEPRSDTRRSTREIALSPVASSCEKHHQTTSTSPITVPHTMDRSCQYSPPACDDDDSRFCTVNANTQVSAGDLPDFLDTMLHAPPRDHSAFQVYSLEKQRTFSTAPIRPAALERTADSGILVDSHRRKRTNFSRHAEMRSSSSDSEDMSEVTLRPIRRHTSSTKSLSEKKARADRSTSELEQEIVQLRRERTHVLDLLSLNWNRSNIWVELTEAKLNFIIEETGRRRASKKTHT